MLKSALYILITSLLCLGACVPGHNDYSQFENISSKGWCYNDTLTFIPATNDSTATGVLTLALRHNNNYIYRNLWVEVSYHNDSVTVADTLNIEFADIYGRWHGKGLASRFQIEDTVSTSFHMVKGSPVKVRHIMRTDTLNGIEQVGIIFISNQNGK